MYLAYPAPDDEEQVRSVEPLQAHIRLAMERDPRRFMMKRRGKIRRLPPARKVSDDPLRLVRRKRLPGYASGYGASDSIPRRWKRFVRGFGKRGAWSMLPGNWKNM